MLKKITTNFYTPHKIIVYNTETDISHLNCLDVEHIKILKSINYKTLTNFVIEISDNCLLLRRFYTLDAIPVKEQYRVFDDPYLVLLEDFKDEQVLLQRGTLKLISRLKLYTQTEQSVQKVKPLLRYLSSIYIPNEEILLTLQTKDKINIKLRNLILKSTVTLNDYGQEMSLIQFLDSLNYVILKA